MNCPKAARPSSPRWLPFALAGLCLLAVPLIPVHDSAPDSVRGSTVDGAMLGSGLSAQGSQATAEDQLTRVAGQFARHWAAGEAGALAPLLATGGIRLHLEGPARSAIPPRHAMAAIRDFLRSYVEGEAIVARVAGVEDSEDRGLVELHWVARVEGTSHAVEHTLFLSMIRADEVWRVEELRLLR